MSIQEREDAGEGYGRSGEFEREAEGRACEGGRRKGKREGGKIDEGDSTDDARWGEVSDNTPIGVLSSKSDYGGLLGPARYEQEGKWGVRQDGKDRSFEVGFRLREFLGLGRIDMAIRHAPFCRKMKAGW
jgi:hypothetical protein